MVPDLAQAELLLGETYARVVELFERLVGPL
jgi:hypothetical protein